MKQILSFLVFTAIAVHSFAQLDAKMYPDLASFKINEPVVVKDVSMKARGKGSKKWSGKNDYKFDTPHMNLNQKSLLLGFGDSLFINCKSILGVKDFAYVAFQSSKYLYFMATRSKKIPGIPPHDNTDKVATAAFLGGAIAAGIVATQDPAILERFDYLYDFQLDKVIYFNRPRIKRYISEATEAGDSDFVVFAQQLLKTREDQGTYYDMAE